MHATTVAIDLAKDVFELAMADASGRVIRRERLSRSHFGLFVETLPTCRIVMEACGGAHHWARRFQAVGHQVVLLPGQYVRPYRRRNKTDRADCLALLEAAKNREILPVAIKTPQSQAILGLHRVRSQWMATRTARINALRGLLREYGVSLPGGAVAGLRVVAAAIDAEAVPPVLRPALHALLAEIRALEARILELEQQLESLSRQSPAILRLRKVSGIGLLTSTALVSSAGSADAFRNGRHLASWLGLTPREYSSGSARRLGSISKRGDVYVRMLLVHGARAALNRAKQLAKAGHVLTKLQRWALDLESRAGHNKATVGLANKLARIAWACWKFERDFIGDCVRVT